jgi:hypothetical protein
MLIYYLKVFDILIEYEQASVQDYENLIDLEIWRS